MIRKIMAIIESKKSQFRQLCREPKAPQAAARSLSFSARENEKALIAGEFRLTCHPLVNIMVLDAAPQIAPRTWGYFLVPYSGSYFRLL